MIPITLSSANVLRFSDNTGALPVEEGGVDYFFGFAYGFEEDESAVAVRAHILAFPKGAEVGDEGIPSREQLAAELDVECTFALDDLDQTRDDQGKVKLPRAFLAHLMGITVSTARGVFIGAGRSVTLQKAPIPIMQTLAMVDGMVDESNLDWIDSAPALPPTDRTAKDGDT